MSDNQLKTISITNFYLKHEVRMLNKLFNIKTKKTITLKDKVKSKFWRFLFIINLIYKQGLLKIL